jgi:hypothetical protein
MGAWVVAKVLADGEGGWTLNILLPGVQDRDDVYDTAAWAKAHAELIAQGWMTMALGNDQ